MNYLFRDTFNNIKHGSMEHALANMDKVISESEEFSNYKRIATFGNYVVVANDTGFRRLTIDEGKIVKSEPYYNPNLMDDISYEKYALQEANNLVKEMLDGKSVDMNSLNTLMKVIDHKKLALESVHLCLDDVKNKIGNIFNPAWSNLIEASEIPDSFDKMMQKLDEWVSCAKAIVIKNKDTLLIESVAAPFAQAIGGFMRSFRDASGSEPRSEDEVKKIFGVLGEQWYDLNITGEYLKKTSEVG